MLLSSAAGLSDRFSDTHACPNGHPRPRPCPYREFRCLLNVIPAPYRQTPDAPKVRQQLRDEYHF